MFVAIPFVTYDAVRFNCVPCALLFVRFGPGRCDCDYCGSTRCGAIRFVPVRGGVGSDVMGLHSLHFRFLRYGQVRYDAV